MSPAPRFRPTRLVALFGIGFTALLLLMTLAFLRYRLASSGISGWLSESFGYRPIKVFGIHYVLRILLPVYLSAGLIAWASTLLPGCLSRRNWLREWKGREALSLGLSALLWMHLVLWWQVPTALWVLPGVRAIPFLLIFPILLTLTLAFPLHWLWRQRDASWLRRASTLTLWLLLWTSSALAPQFIPRPAPEARGGDQACKVLMLGVDGLRSDTFLAHSRNFSGIPYQNAYTVIPATRLLWHILWGGDPMTYTIGHVGATLDEFQRPHDLALLRQAQVQGWKPRFYIDDGGTISLAGRQMDLDDSLMPAAGWENFVNSNLAASFPLYAVWENWFKPFPTTNPWASMDAGLKEALRLGRGSSWVMFHSCLAHQPIYLTRQEMGQTGRWWTLHPKAYEPKSHIASVSLPELLAADPRTNPFRAYQVRMDSILSSWAIIWNRLPEDPAYKDSVRVLFSDHGERFHTIAPGFQLHAVHGYNLDPWECRVAMLLAGPGFSDRAGEKPRETSVSLLSVRDGIERLLSKSGPFDAAFFESSMPSAPIRYHTLATSAFGVETESYRAEPEKDLAQSAYIAPEGIWYIEYKQSAEERAKDASLAIGEGADSYYYKPLTKGGAMKFHFRAYEFVTSEEIDEPAFQEAKVRVEALLKRKNNNNGAKTH